MTSRWNDEPVRRTTPPSQPKGWVDPPERTLIDDGYLDEREPWSGWDGEPRRTDHRWLILAALIVAVAVLVLQVTRAKAEEPTSQVGTAIYSASATWCAPTPDKCQGWGGNARLAAVNSFRFGDRPYWVRIERGEDHADALVVSHCACRGSDGYIDVSRAVFRQLAPLSRGQVDVVVEVLAWPYEPGGDPPPHPDDDRMRAEDSGPKPTLPPTDAVK